MQDTKYYVYLIKNKINGMKYIGRRACNCEIKDDLYFGSGTFLKQALQKYGTYNFEKTILCVCKTLKECIDKEIELIEFFDAVNSKDYYNVAPGGLSRPDGFVMSKEEKKKREYLIEMMNEEIIYAVKIEDKERLIDRIPRIILAKVYNDKNDIFARFHFISDDTQELKSKKYDYNGRVLSKTQKMNGPQGIESWLYNTNYTIITEKTYKNIMINALESSRCFRLASEMIKTEYKNSRNNKNKESQVNVKTECAQNYKGKRSDAVNCIYELSDELIDYKNVKDLYETYEEFGLGFAEIYHAVTGLASVVVSRISDGSLKCSNKQKKTAIEILDYEKRFLVIPIKGRRDYFNMALAFCYGCEEIDNDELYRKIKKKYSKMSPMKSIAQAIAEIEKIYNYRRREKVHIVQKYMYVKQDLN